MYNRDLELQDDESLQLMNRKIATEAYESMAEQSKAKNKEHNKVPTKVAVKSLNSFKTASELKRSILSERQDLNADICPSRFDMLKRNNRN